jgi:hypothetical protein
LGYVKKGELKTTQNQICPNKKKKNPPYAKFFSTKGALFLIFGIQKVSKKRKKALDVKGQKNVFL